MAINENKNSEKCENVTTESIIVPNGCSLCKT